MWNINFRQTKKAVFFTLLIHVNLNMQVFRLSLRRCWCVCSSGIWLLSYGCLTFQVSVVVSSSRVQYPINPWWQKQYAVSKRSVTITQLHSTTSQKYEHLKLNSILTAVLLALLKFMRFSSQVASNNRVKIFTAQINGAFFYLSPFTVWIYSLQVYFVMYTINIWHILF